MAKKINSRLRQDIDKHVAAVFVATPDGRTIAGDYTLSNYVIDVVDLSEELKQFKSKHAIFPATLIGRLARALAYKGTGLGELLLMNALERALNIIRESASLVVVAKERAIRFDWKYGFIQLLPEHPNRMFLPMKTVAVMFP